MKISCLNPIAAVGMQLFTDAYEKVDDFAASDAALVRSASVHELELPDQLLAIARAGAGVNNIPLDKCAEKGIVVFNTPGANANGVKEAVLAGLFLGARDIVGGVNWVQTVKEDPNVAKLVEKGKKQFAGTEIMGKKIGVIGLGAIGVLVANACVALGMEVYGYDPFISVDAAWNLSKNIKHIANVEDIYENCDYITVHVPLMDSTKKMINADAFAKMKDGVIVLNFARDLLVDDDALEAAIAAGKVRKYITDFPNAKTAQMNGVVAIPHLGASTEESEDNCAVMAVKELRDYLENGNITHSVNYPACDMGICKAAGRITICHKNIPNMLGQLTGACAAEGINIEDMTNKSKGDWAYTMMDIGSEVSEALVEKLAAINGVVKVRKVKEALWQMSSLLRQSGRHLRWLRRWRLCLMMSITEKKQRRK